MSADDAGKLSRFLKNIKGFKVVGLYTESSVMDEFAAEGVFDRVAQGHECRYPKKRMGCDILGRQYLGNSDFSFTSYMSGGLDEVIEERSQTPLVLDTATGLMLNPYDEAASFCSLIQGMGEPVIWTPFEIYEIMV
ncbi:MAG: hypothetical protein J6F31_04640 [Oscillospiraceae bacterium]|nr:hypothetical protein [Oscillospiraceae bacterium]